MNKIKVSTFNNKMGKHFLKKLKRLSPMWVKDWETFAWKANFHIPSESLKVGTSFDPSISHVGFILRSQG